MSCNGAVILSERSESKNPCSYFEKNGSFDYGRTPSAQDDKAF